MTSSLTPGAAASHPRSSDRAAPLASTSSADIGSSSSSSGGRPIIARASATRCACPPDSSPGRRVATSASSKRPSQRSASARATPRATPRASSPYATLSTADSDGNSASP